MIPIHPSFVGREKKLVKTLAPLRFVSIEDGERLVYWLGGLYLRTFSRRTSENTHSRKLWLPIIGRVGNQWTGVSYSGSIVSREQKGEVAV